ncbi:uncharacterized protein IWZ02DRAFT_456012 [Phyllosticta citriasiana]|uniref:Secreted protein n=1 Tax=Phyllosticta citriasiana TaxID=595635 RepID=A0ABR1KYP8_9PEZI
MSSIHFFPHRSQTSSVWVCLFVVADAASASALRVASALLLQPPLSCGKTSHRYNTCNCEWPVTTTLRPTTH